MSNKPKLRISIGDEYFSMAIKINEKTYFKVVANFENLNGSRHHPIQVQKFDGINNFYYWVNSELVSKRMKDMLAGTRPMLLITDDIIERRPGTGPNSQCFIDYCLTNNYLT